MSRSVSLPTAIGLSLLLGLAAWPEQMLQALSVALLMLAAIAVAVAVPQRLRSDGAAMPLTFVLDFSALLLFGPRAMILVALAGSIAQVLARRGPGALLMRSALLHLWSILLATLASAFTHAQFGGTVGQFLWPWQALPMAAAAVVYAIVINGISAFAKGAGSRESATEAGYTRVLRGGSIYIVGAGVAAALAEMVAHRAWQILIVAAVPLFFAGRAYALSGHVEEEDDSPAAADAVDQPIAVIDRLRRVMEWNDALARLVNCPAGQVVGRSITDALPFLRERDYERAIDEALRTRRPRTLDSVRFFAGQTSLVLRADILPHKSGAQILWRDVTEAVTANEALRKEMERLVLASEGANGGLWVWDRHTRELWVSARWRAIVGLPPQSGTVRPEEWLDRVHPDDIVPLKEALDAHLSGRTDHFQHEHRIRHEDGSYRWFLCRGVAARSSDGQPDPIAGSLADITELADAQEHIKNATASDPLTGLTTRAVFVERVGKGLAHFKQRHTGRFAVLYLDLDRFKVVNDSLGHLVGDELLISVSRRLESCVRSGDVLARLGGDEFAIMLNGLGDDMQANLMALRIQDALAAPFAVGGREVFTSVSIGIACCRPEYSNPEEIMRDADTAMYHAKTRGKARHELFDADMRARALDRLGLENDLRHAVRTEALELHYQPIVSLASTMCVGFEALVRWTRNGRPVSPADFIPIAEELGLIDSLGEWVLRQSCQSFTAWRRRYPAVPLECITVNVSARQLAQHGFLILVERIVEENGMRPGDLRLEITETALMDNHRQAAEVLGGLRDFGVKVYLDDFGTGYSSLSHLHKLPVDALKIDRSFVRSLLLTDRPAIVESILALARTLDTVVVAEGVESEQQARELERLGCRHAQGFFFSRPLTAGDVDELLAANRPLGRSQLHLAEPPSTPHLIRAV